MSTHPTLQSLDPVENGSRSYSKEGLIGELSVTQMYDCWSVLHVMYAQGADILRYSMTWRTGLGVGSQNA